METEITVIDRKHIDYEAIGKAGRIIKGGGLVAFPTETVYGLGGDAFNPDSSRKIYAAKGRPSDNPLIVHIYRLEDLELVAEDIPENAFILADRFWPGPLTMIFKKKASVPGETTGGLDTVAVRMPSDDIAREFIKASGGFVAAPSANISGRPSPTVAKYVIEDMSGRIDMIIDGGASDVGLESTIIDLSGDKPEILRPGFITREMLSDALSLSVEYDRAIIEDNSDIKPKAPGMKYRHYAPRAELTIIEGDTSDVVGYINEVGTQALNLGKKVGVIATEETVHLYNEEFSVKSAGTRKNEADPAHYLFTILREFDDEDVQIIYSESFNETGVGVATMNRLLKAAGHRVLKV